MTGDERRETEAETGRHSWLICVPPPPSSVTSLPSAGRALFARPASAFGTSVVVLFLFLAVFGVWLAPYDASRQLSAEARQPPSASHWFGTDRLGRDVFSRVIVGTRDIVGLAGAGSLVAVALGALIGMLSAYAGGWLDEVVFRLFDSLLALPSLLVALLLLGTAGPSRNSVLVVIVIVYTPIVARVVRSVVLATKPKAFVEAARTQGASLPDILGRELLPCVLPALAVESALRFSYAIFLVASLGFLGVGVQPPSPDWGLMVKENRDYAALTPWALYFPVGAISLTVVGVNLMADELRRVLTR